MGPTVDAMLTVYTAALRRHQQHLDDGCDRRAWHALARHLDGWNQAASIGSAWRRKYARSYSAGGRSPVAEWSRR